MRRGCPCRTLGPGAVPVRQRCRGRRQPPARRSTGTVRPRAVPVHCPGARPVLECHMALADFPRHPLTFGPSPVHPLPRSQRTCHRRKRRADLGQARRLQRRSRVRRQQDAQAGVPGPRGARAGRGHAGLDRRLPVQPHPAGRRGRRAPRHEVRAGPGELGPGLDRPAEHPGRQHPDEPGHGRRGAARPGRLRHRVPRLLASGARRRRGARREAVRDPGGRVGPPAGRSRLRRLGVRGGRAGARARRLLRHGRRVHGHRLDPRRDDRRVRSAGGGRRATATGDRHRRVRDAGEDARPGLPDRPQHRRADRSRPRPARRRDHGARGLGR